MREKSLKVSAVVEVYLSTLIYIKMAINLDR